MTMKPVTLICVLLLLESVLAEPCKDKTYKFLFTPTRNVTEELKTGFTIKNYTQPDACPSADTVCVSNPVTTVEFSGFFTSSFTKIKISGEGKTAEIPIAINPNILTKEMVAEFPVSGTLPFSERKSFFIKGNLQTMGCVGGYDDDFIEVEDTEVCADGKLCYLGINSKPLSLTIWGTKGSFNAIFVILHGGKTVLIPLIHLKANSVSPDPLALQMIQKTPNVTVKVRVPFIVDTVINDDPNPQIHEKPDCEESSEPCYQIFGPTSATFKGKMPANPVTITLSSDMQTNTYIFGSIAPTLRSGFVAFMTVSAALLAAPI